MGLFLGKQGTWDKITGMLIIFLGKSRIPLREVGILDSRGFPEMIFFQQVITTRVFFSQYDTLQVDQMDKHLLLDFLDYCYEY